MLLCRWLSKQQRFDTLVHIVLASCVSFRIVSKSTLRKFWEHHPDAQRALERWHTTLSTSNAKSLSELKETFGSADFVQPHYIIFSLTGGYCHVITRVYFRGRAFYIHEALTHVEYKNWKP
jgi:mRNA interferase HigB